MQAFRKFLPLLTPHNFQNLPYPKLECTPKLPLPKLKDTLCKYLDYIDIYVGDAGSKKSRKLVEDFESTAGATAQACLEERFEKSNNWAIELVNKEWYLKPRVPKPIYISPGCVMPPRKFNSENNDDLYKCCAAIVDTVLNVKEKVDCKAVEIEKFKSGIEKDTSQWYNILTTCDVPEKEIDSVVTTLNNATGQEHIIVMHQGQIFGLIAKHMVDGTPTRLSFNELMQAFKSIVENSNLDGPSMGLLTTMERDKWAEVYCKVIEDPKNKLNMDIIQSSLIVLCIDEAVTADYNAKTCKTNEDDYPYQFMTQKRDATSMMHQMIHGCGTEANSGNRWYDKPLQFVVSKDGVLGLVMGHTCVDGTICFTMMQIALDSINEERCIENEEVDLPEEIVLPLCWNTTPEIESTVIDAGNDINSLIRNYDFYVMRYPEFGGAWIKEIKLSPDAVVQLALQLAYYRINGNFESTWESVATVKYRLARSDVGRSISREAMIWVRAMVCNCPNDSGIQIKLFETAVQEQAKQTVENADGKGVDVHLLALREVSEEMTGCVHKIFEDDAYKAFSKYKLITSQNSTKRDTIIAGYGFEEPDAYSVCYNIQPDHIIFTCGSCKVNKKCVSAEELGAMIERCLNQIKTLMSKKRPT